MRAESSNYRKWRHGSMNLAASEEYFPTVTGFEPHNVRSCTFIIEFMGTFWI